MLTSPYRNEFLSSLSQDQLSRLEPYLERVPLIVGEALIESFEEIEYIHFVETGLLAVNLGGSSDQVQAGVIGREGMSGLAVALDCDASPFGVLVQMPGEAYRVRSLRFREACQASPDLHRRVLRYSQVCSVQTAETARANARFALEAKLARWLLMVHDRTDADDIRLTHEFLSTMLGVRRPGVTVALHVLEGKHLIRSRRGTLKIVDRAGLEVAARGTYGLPEAEYRRTVARSDLGAKTWQREVPSRPMALVS